MVDKIRLEDISLSRFKKDAAFFTPGRSKRLVDAKGITVAKFSAKTKKILVRNKKGGFF